MNEHNCTVLFPWDSWLIWIYVGICAAMAAYMVYKSTQAVRACERTKQKANQFEAELDKLLLELQDTERLTPEEKLHIIEQQAAIWGERNDGEE